MPTTKKRINLTISDEIDGVLQRLAMRDNIPQATEAVRLIKIALEVDEDDVWNTLAEGRDTPNAKFISHKEAWS